MDIPMDADQLSVPNNLVDLLKIQQSTRTSLARLREITAKLDMDPEEVVLIDEMLDRIEQHRFTIAVVGEFKRGKSTFVNALLGEEVLPADVLPTTATLNRVTYDVTPFIEIVYREDSDRAGQVEQIAIDQLKNYVTKLTDDARRRAGTIKEAIIHYDNKYLRKSVDIIDTPGLNDDDTMTAVTMGVLPYIDTAVMVLMPENPFGGYEGDFLNKLLLNDLGRVIFVVNGIDRIYNPDDRVRLKSVIEQRILAAVEKRAEELFGTGPETADERELHIKRIGYPRVFMLSSADALDAKLENDDELLDQSKFPAFEAGLEQFLTNERGIATLQALTARVIASGVKINQRLGQLIGATQMSQQEFDQAYERSSSELALLRQQLHDELRRIDTTIEKTRQKVRPLIARLGDEIKDTTTHVIEAAKISAADIARDKQPALIEKLGREVTRSVEDVSRTVAERAQFVIQQELEIELDKVSDFASAVDRSLHSIDLQFTRALALSADNLNIKAQLVGNLTGAGMFVGGSMLLVKGVFLTGVAVISLPVALLMFAGVGLASLLAGNQMAKRLFANDRVENFRRTFREAALLQIDQQMQAQYPAIERQFDDHIGDTFAALKRDLQRELGGVIEQAQRNLDETRLRRERNQTLTEVQLRDYEHIQSEAQRIISKAHGLSNHLQDIKGV